MVSQMEQEIGRRTQNGKVENLFNQNQLINLLNSRLKTQVSWGLEFHFLIRFGWR